MTDNLGGNLVEGAADAGIDDLHQDNVEPVVGWLASDAASDVNGQVLMVTGGWVHLMTHFEPVGEIRRDRRWTVAELIDAKGELFGDRFSKVPRFGVGE